MQASARSKKPESPYFLGSGKPGLEMTGALVNVFKTLVSGDVLKDFVQTDKQCRPGSGAV